MEVEKPKLRDFNKGKVYGKEGIRIRMNGNDGQPPRVLPMGLRKDPNTLKDPNGNGMDRNCILHSRYY